MAIKIISDEDAEFNADNYKTWQLKQPEFIAVPVEMNELCQKANITNYGGGLISFNAELKPGLYFIANYGGGNLLYKKVKNPKIPGKAVMKWPE